MGNNDAVLSCRSGGPRGLAPTGQQGGVVVWPLIFTLGSPMAQPTPVMSGPLQQLSHAQDAGRPGWLRRSSKQKHTPCKPLKTRNVCTTFLVYTRVWGLVLLRVIGAHCCYLVYTRRICGLVLLRVIGNAQLIAVTPFKPSSY